MEPLFRHILIVVLIVYLGLLREHAELRDKILLRNSDAHYLEHMLEPNAWIALPECTPECLIAALNGEIEVTWK